MEKKYCVYCGKKEEYSKDILIRRYEGKEYSFDVSLEVPYCNNCHFPILTNEIENKYTELANNKIREAKNIISRDEIVDIIDSYAVSQKNLSRMLGWGEITLTRYVNKGFTPSFENSNKLRMLKNPYVFLEYYNKFVFSNDSTKAKTLKCLDGEFEKIEKENGKIFTVINWFLKNSSEETPITHLAMQKLLYFSQSWSKILTGEWMFEDSCQAWVHGAVYPEIYKYFSWFGYKKLPMMIERKNMLSSQELKVLEFIKTYYFDVYNAKALEKLCHNEEPFINARMGLQPKEVSQRIIDRNDIYNYYSKISQKYNIDFEHENNVKKYLNSII